MDITVMMTTCNRYITTLPMALLAVVNQTYKPKTIILVDDSKEKKFYDHEILKNILILFKIKDIEFKYLHGPSKGQIVAQQMALEKIETDFYFSTDDDNIMEPNVLELCVKNMKDGFDNGLNIGAISGLILTRKDVLSNREIEYKTDKYYNKIKDIYRYYNIQMCPNQDSSIKKVEHIYSNYFVRTKLIDKYPVEFLHGCHRSETLLTHEIFRKGCDLIVDPNIKIWHLHDETGGNRIFKKEDYTNDILFLNKLKEWKTDINIIENSDGAYEKREDGSLWLIYGKR